jgi:hypothetical protein
MQTLQERDALQAKINHHCALIMQILKKHPDGLTTMQIQEKEKEYFGFMFLTDNRLRDCRRRGWVENTATVPMRWKVKDGDV